MTLIICADQSVNRLNMARVENTCLCVTTLVEQGLEQVTAGRRQISGDCN